MERARIVLKPREDLRLRGGHPWIYDNEIARIEEGSSGGASPGSEVEVFDARRQLVGVAFYNPASRIRARLYSRAPRNADRAFFVETLGRALAWRRRFFDPARQSLRLVFGEADGLPGLVVDSFVGEAEGGPSSGRGGTWLSAQFLSLGVELRKSDLLSALAEVFPSDGVVERSDAPVRAFEGLQPAVGLLSGEVPPLVLIEEGGLRFAVDMAGGQKTGWFLDQRANRAAAARHAKGRNVLDAFCNAGGFGLACAAAGASEVLAVDSSANAIRAASANAARNGLADHFRVQEGNAFDVLRALERERRRFGLIVLDPPAFAKNRAAIEGARRGYKDLNLRALKLLEPGGVLVTCSCSHWFGVELFRPMLEDAAHDAGRRLRLVEERTQDLDHPIVSGYPESRYLKCFIVEAD